jgi:hypothetical protein
MRHARLGRVATAFRAAVMYIPAHPHGRQLTLLGVADNAADDSNDYVNLPLQRYADMVLDSAQTRSGTPRFPPAWVVTHLRPIAARASGLRLITVPSSTIQ